MSAHRRTSRLVAAAAIFAAVAAAVPALHSGPPNPSAGSAADKQPGQVLSSRVTPAPANALAPVSRTARVRSTHTSRGRVGHGATRVTGTPTKVLNHPEHGAAAIAALGAKLPTVAANTGWSPTKLRSVLSSDDSAFVSEQGRVYYREDDLPAEASSAPVTAQTTAVAPIYPTSQTFALHSRAGATRKIFLDFDGATVSDTGWNGTGAGKTPNGSHTGFDLDGNPSTFSTAEHGYIQEVWREVSEDYAPFDVDVTTQDPGVAGITRSSAGDTAYGTHVVITGDPAPRTNLCSGSCLGVAYVGTFDNVDTSGGYYQPAWVFDYDTGFDPMIIAQAAAHETGHTLGLSHDGTSTADYSFGTPAWGPLMGGSMNRAVTQWSKGEYADANNQQDDLQIIQDNGLPLRPDDYPGTTALGSQASYAVSGVISTRTDTDDFSVTLPCVTTLAVSVKGIGKQTSLDLSLSVLNSNGQTVASSSPMSTYSGNPPVSAGMNASVSVPGATGTYTLRVDGVGNGSPSGGGWSDYGSLGQYTLTSSGCGATTSTPSPSMAVPTPAPIGTSMPQPAAGDSPSSAPPAPAAQRAPGAPRIGTATAGPKRGPRTAWIRWAAPTTTSQTPVASYRAQAVLLDRRGRVRRVYTTRALGASVRAVSWQLPRGKYRFRVRAYNQVGASAWSGYSRTVSPR